MQQGGAVGQHQVLGGSWGSSLAQNDSGQQLLGGQAQFGNQINYQQTGMMSQTAAAQGQRPTLAQYNVPSGSSRSINGSVGTDSTLPQSLQQLSAQHQAQQQQLLMGYNSLMQQAPQQGAPQQAYGLGGLSDLSSNSASQNNQSPNNNQNQDVSGLGIFGRASIGALLNDPDPFFKPSFSDFIDAIPDMPDSTALAIDNANMASFTFFPPEMQGVQGAGASTMPMPAPAIARPVAAPANVAHSPSTSQAYSPGPGHSMGHSAHAGGSMDGTTVVADGRNSKCRRNSYTASDHSGSLSPATLSPTSSLLNQFANDMVLRNQHSPGHLLAVDHMSGLGSGMHSLDGSQSHSDNEKKQTTRDKNREAQRRYREKQRSALATLQLKTDEQRRVIEGLQREKRMVEEHNRVLLERVWRLEELVEKMGINPKDVGGGGAAGGGGSGGTFMQPFMVQQQQLQQQQQQLQQQAQQQQQMLSSGLAASPSSGNAASPGGSASNA